MFVISKNGVPPLPSGEGVRGRGLGKRGRGERDTRGRKTEVIGLVCFELLPFSW